MAVTGEVQTRAYLLEQPGNGHRFSLASFPSRCGAHRYGGDEKRERVESDDRYSRPSDATEAPAPLVAPAAIHRP